MKISDDEWNALAKLTRRTRLDDSFDVWIDEDGNDCFMDFDEDKIQSLDWGLEQLEDCIAYPLTHEGLTIEECDAIVELFKRFNIGNEDYYKWLLIKED